MITQSDYSGLVSITKACERHYKLNFLSPKVASLNFLYHQSRVLVVDCSKNGTALLTREAIVLKIEFLIAKVSNCI